MHSWATLYLTILTAYLIAAYRTGARLSESQTMIINTGFVVFAGLQIFGATASGMRSIEFVAELQAINPERKFSLTPGVLWIVV